MQASLRNEYMESNLDKATNPSESNFESISEQWQKKFSEDNFSKIKRHPFYFGEQNQSLLGWLHSSDSVEPTDLCVVICAPLGLEYMNSYRSLRYLADYLALAGIPAIRFDYHGTGDSSGFNRQENRLTHWQQSISDASEKIKELSGAKKLAIFGLGIGGTVAATSELKSTADFLILWGSPDRGKRFARELKALQMTSAIDSNDLSGGRLEAGGMIYWPETIDAISQINLQQIKPSARKVLLLERDDVPVMKKLTEKWAESGGSIELAKPSGFADMLQNAHLSIVPHSALKAIVVWLYESANINDKSPATTKTKNLLLDNIALENTELDISIPEDAPSNVLLEQGNPNISESFFRFGKDKSGFGIVTRSKTAESSNLPKIVLLNSGATHRVAPGRLYVLLARQLAKFGFEVFRVDLPGLGDSQINNRQLERIEYPDEPSEKIEIILQAIEEQSPGCKFVVMGLCSGAYHSFKFGLETTRKNILESLLINPLVFYWDKRASVDSFARNFSDWNDFKLALTNLNSWKRFFKFEINLFSKIKIILIRICVKLESIMRRMVGKSSESSECGSTGNLNTDLVSFLNKGIKLSFFFSREDPGYDLLKTSANVTAPKLIKEEKIDVAFIEKADHTFSKFRPKHKAIELIVSHLVARYTRNR